MKFESFQRPKKINEDNQSSDAEKKSPKYYKIKKNLQLVEKSMTRTLEEVKSRRDQILKSEKSLLLSKNDFDKYFLSKESETGIQMEQQNVGDCYLLAAIYALACSPYFEIMCRSSMKRNPDGSWQVKIPLLNENGRIININQAELLSSWNKNFLKKDSENSILPDLRIKLLPVKAKEGIRVL